MSNRRESDASLLIGIVLGVFVGSAVALVLSPQSGEDNRAALSEKVDQARQSLEKEKARVEGASEGSAG